MEAQAVQEFQTRAETRSQHRKRVFEGIPNPVVKERLAQAIDARQLEDPAVITYMTGSLGKQAHSVFFDLASTADSPEELKDIFKAISALSTTQWAGRSESEDAFFNRPGRFAPRETSQGAKQLSARILRTGSISPFLDESTAEFADNMEHLVETELYLLSSPYTALSVKRSLLNSLSKLQTVNQAIFDENASFWEHVDGLWTNSSIESPSPSVKKSPDQIEGENWSLKRALEHTRGEVASLTEANQQQKDELAESIQREFEGMEREIALTAQTQELIRMRDEGNRKNADIATRNQQLQKEPKRLRKEIQELEHDLDAERKAKHDLARQYQQQEIDLISLRADNQQKDNDLAALRTDNQQKDNDLAALRADKQREDQSAGGTEEAAMLTAEIQQLRNSLSSARIQIRTLTERQQHEEAEIRRLRAENARLQGASGGTSKPDIFKILGMPPTATAQQVRDAFRKRITATHGDSFQGKIRKAGAIFSPAEREELFKVMEQSTKDLNAAYNAYQGR